MKKLSIGIDPGSRTGIAIYDGIEERVIETKTVNYSDAMQTIMELVKANEESLAVIGVEVSHSRRIYQRRRQGIHAMRKIAHNVGDCFRKAESLYYFSKAMVSDKKIAVYRLRPRGTKLSRDEFELVSGYSASYQSSSHSRDAGVVAMRAYSQWRLDQMTKEDEERFNDE